MACPKVRVFRMRRVSVTLLFFLKKIHFMCRKKAARHRSAKRSFLLCISLPCGNEGIAGFLGIGKSWNSANRGVRNNHTKPTIKPVCRLGKLAEFLDKSRRNDRKSNEMRWVKSTTRVLLSGRPWVRIPPGAPKTPKNPRFRAQRLLTALHSGIGVFLFWSVNGAGAPAHIFKEPLADF